MRFIAYKVDNHSLDVYAQSRREQIRVIIVQRRSHDWKSNDLHSRYQCYSENT